MVLVVGEILFDIFLEYRRLGGEISDYICSIEGAVPVDDDIYKNNLTMEGGLDAV
jgi:hypothetical protein